MSLSLHVAFDVALEDVLTAPERLRAQGVEALSFFGAPTNEPSVLAWMPAAAVYFRDPDGHQLDRQPGQVARRTAEERTWTSLTAGPRSSSISMSGMQCALRPLRSTSGRRDGFFGHSPKRSPELFCSGQVPRL